MVMSAPPVKEFPIATIMKIPPPDESRAFDEAFDRIIALREEAESYVGFEDAHAAAAKGMQRSRQAYLDCARAFVWLQESGSWKARYDTWPALVAATGFERGNVYRMLRCAKTFDGVPAAAQEMLGTLSARQLSTFAEADDEERSALLKQVTETGDVDGAFVVLRNHLFDSREKQIKKPRRDTYGQALAVVKRHTKFVLRWFKARGLGDQAQPHLAALEELARSGEAKRAEKPTSRG